MFEPGHLHIVHPALQPDDIGYDLHIRYEVGETDSGPGMQFTLEGEINGQAVNEAFELPKDKAYNFASEASRRLEKHACREPLTCTRCTASTTRCSKTYATSST